MGDTERLLLEAVKVGLMELSKKKLGAYHKTDTDGMHYVFGGEEYVISVSKVGVTSRELTKLSPTRDSRSLEELTTSLLHDMGIPASLKGFYYLRQAIITVAEDPRAIDAMVKFLYPTVGEKFGVTPSKVERCIRHAIETAWNRGNLELLQSMFKYSVSYSKSKPTNSEFIGLVADTIRLNRKVGMTSES